MFKPFERATNAAGSSERWQITSLCLALVVALLWPAAVNRDVFIFADTTAYVRGADAAMVKLTGMRSDWSDQLFSRYADATGITAKGRSDAAKARESREAVLAGRSVYYGAFVFVLDALGSFWAVAIVQAALVAAAMILAVRRVVGEVSTRTLLPLLILPFVTSVAFFSVFMMPDILNPLSIGATAMIGIYWKGMTRGERLFWISLLLFGLVAHSANIVIIGALAAAITLSKLISRAATVVVMPVFLALAGAVLAEVVFSIGVAKITGYPPVRPPFISARLIDDGPGYRYLVKECRSGRRFALCDYLARMPAHSDEMLWSRSPIGGIFSTVSAEEKRRISADELPFVLGVTMNRPLEVLATTTHSIIVQARAFGMMEFNGQNIDPAKLPPRMRAQYLSSRAVKGNFDVKTLETVFLATFWLSAALILTVFVRDIKQGLLKEETRLVALIALGLVANIAVAGALSTPHDRYQARAAWLLPLAAVLIMTSAYLRRRPNPAFTAPLAEQSKA